MKTRSDAEEAPQSLLRDATNTPPQTLPPAVTPPGLDKKRQWYLFCKIREFCREDTLDTVCPRPAGEDVALSSDSEAEETVTPETSETRKKKAAAQKRKKETAVKKKPAKKKK